MFTVDTVIDIIFEMNFVIRIKEISQTFTLPFLPGGRFTINLLKDNLQKVINMINDILIEKYENEGKNIATKLRKEFSTKSTLNFLCKTMATNFM